MKTLWSSVSLVIIVLQIGNVSGDTQYDEINKQIRPDDYLVMPDRQGPFPVAIILHTSEGPQKMDRAWARTLADNGIAGLVVKSYSHFNGGYSTKSRSFNRLREMTPDRVQHILATIDYLKTQAWADPTRIALLGRSHGAWAALWFLATEMTVEDDKGIKAIVAYYPDCETRQPYIKGWSAQVPVFIQMGKNDRSTATQPCMKMVKSQRAVGRPVIFELYEIKGHDLDLGNDKIAKLARMHTLQFMTAILNR